jgi:serine/threonine-protein phosphatase PGAM5
MKKLKAGWAEPQKRGRILHLVRHGQYEDGESGSGNLTLLGRRQARHVARYLARLPIARIVSSDVSRAIQTAEILSREIRIPLSGRHSLLREVLPTRVAGLRVPVEKRVAHVRRIERVIKKFFKASRGVRHEIIVCHGNLIRSLVLRVAVGRVDGWHRLVAHHAAVTSFAVSSHGMVVLGFNAQDHLPLKLRTTR